MLYLFNVPLHATCNAFFALQQPWPVVNCCYKMLHSVIVKILNIYIMLSCTHLYHFFRYLSITCNAFIACYVIPNCKMRESMYGCKWCLCFCFPLGLEGTFVFFTFPTFWWGTFILLKKKVIFWSFFDEVFNQTLSIHGPIEQERVLLK